VGDAKGVSAYGGIPSASTPVGGYSPLVGGEAVPIDLRVARIGSRAVAALLDFVLQIFVFGFIGGILGNLGIDVAAEQALIVTFLVLVFIGYPVIMEVAWGGRTLGKAAMGLRAVREDGGPLRFRHALVRALLGVFVEKPGVTLGLAAIICSLTSARGKRLGDLLAGTVVIQARLPSSGAYVPPMPPPLAGWATTLDLSRFPDALALQCRQLLGRASQLQPEARERLGASLVASVQALVAPLPPPGTPGWAYISAVLAERRRREEMRLYPAGYRRDSVYSPAAPYPAGAPVPAPAPGATWQPALPATPVFTKQPDAQQAPPAEEPPTGRPGGFAPPT
jgi:uncharacterized RDD family membrane protein YckC